MTKSGKIIVNLKPKKKANKRRKRVQEQELTRLGAALRGLGGFAGGTLGAMVGQPSFGATAGHNLAGALSRWLGSGAYRVSSNSIVTRSGKDTTNSVAAMHSQNQSIVVRHKEFLGEIKGSTSFTVQSSYSLNPGLPGTFPWLHGVASQYQEYRFRGVVFHYIPTSGNAVSSTNPALGSVMLQTSYRSSDNVPASKVEMLNEYWACEGVPSETFVHPIECSPKENPFSIQYVRSGPVPTGDSVLMYDLGVTHVATSGQQASGNVLGDLWVTYEVELRKPIVASNVTNAPLATVIATAPTLANYFAGAQTIKGMAITLPSTGKTFTLPPGLSGIYCLVVDMSGPFTSFNSGPITYVNAATYNSSPIQIMYPIGTGTMSDFIFIAYFTVTNSNLPVIVTLDFTLGGPPSNLNMILTNIF